MVDAPAAQRLMRLPDNTAEIVFCSTNPYREATARRDLELLLEAHITAEDYVLHRRLSLRRQLVRARRMQWVMWAAGLALGLAIGKGWWP